MSILNKTALKDFLIRLFFCLPFVLTVFYSHSYHGELINNSQAQWQYLNDDKRNIYLAIDVYAPSGIKIDGIFSHNRDITDSWRLINYPDWYKGRENFKKLSEFQGLLHPYLPQNKDFNVLYANGWYTFLYEWRPVSPAPIPPENSLKLRYQNQGTQNYYRAKHILGAKVSSRIIKLTSDDYPLIEIKILYPVSLYGNYENNITFENLAATSDPSMYLLKDLRNDSNKLFSNYSIIIYDKKGNIVDSLKGSVKWDKEGAYQVYTKKHFADVFTEIGRRIDFGELLRHVVAIIFIVYFVLICWYIGRRFTRWRSIIFDNLAARLIVPIFLGILILTYLFFVIGILKLLYFPVLFGILSIILFFGFETIDIFELKTALSNEFKRIKNAPWRVAFLTLLAGMLIYNLSYCFVPVTHFDGSADIDNSYFPNVNGYVISHSFKAAIENSTTGITPQGLDVLRAVAKIIVGDPGIYLLSFVYLALILGAMYLIGKEIFNIEGMLVYLAVLLLLSSDLFTEGIHFGKLHIAALSFLFISLYSMRFSDHRENSILPALFFSFLVSQYIHFILAAMTYYIFVIVRSYYNYKATNVQVFRLHMKSFILFFLLSLVFPLKLIFEVGVFLPPGMMPIWLSDLFLKLNYDNAMYKYIDNNYIMNFYNNHLHISMTASGADIASVSRFLIIGVNALFRNLDYYYLLIFLPLVLMVKKNRDKITYIILIFAILYLLSITYPFNIRLRLFYIYPFIILLFSIIDSFVSLIFPNTMRIQSGRENSFIGKGTFILLLLFMFIFEVSVSGIKIRSFKWIEPMTTRLDHKIDYKGWFFDEVFPVFLGIRSKYQYMRWGNAYINFDYALLIRQYTSAKDRILIMPVRYHSYAMRLITPRHALGSVIYQKDLNKIMVDLKKLNINYLSHIPLNQNYKNPDDYNPFYSPIFEDEVFYKYFKLLFSYNERRFYEIVYDGTNTGYHPSPYKNIKELPFVPMLIE